MNLTEILFIIYSMMVFGATVEEYQMNKQDYKNLHWFLSILVKLTTFILFFVSLPIIAGQVIIKKYLKP